MALCRCSRGSGGRPAPAPYSARHSALSLRWLWRLPATQHGRSAVPPRRQLRGRSYRRASALEALQRLLPPRLAAALPPRATRPQIIGEIGVIRLGAASELRNSRYLPLLGQVQTPLSISCPAVLPICIASVFLCCMYFSGAGSAREEPAAADRSS